ncbi:MAG: chromosome segregation SMC family protein [Thermoleophilaceae bacterium]
MHLRAIALKGFKSFPHRTRLEFGPGVSVIVGPNGSGKSNITDAVLWALGEQSPLAVRGQTMKDVIFAGGHGIKGSAAAEVEVVIDNSDRRLASDFSEISIARRLERDGEGGYRLNGARCRLVDVLEVLSDSGLGKEMHSVVSQGRVESIVLSRPRERRLLIEEAAGLGKHRKRRRRAQLKLERTQENLSRSLDVEREARSRLRPLKRQAEAAELHERLERQSLEARLELARDDLRGIRLELATAESGASAARAERDQAERLLRAVAERREAAEATFAAHSRSREQLQARLYSARSAGERIGMRLERVREQLASTEERAGRRRTQLELLEQALNRAPGSGGMAERVATLERELAALESERQRRLSDGMSELEAQLERARARHADVDAEVERARRELESAEASAEAAREARHQAERATESARGRAAQAGAELAAVNQFLRGTGVPSEARQVADGLHVEEGYELALAAALGPRLSAPVVEDVRAGQALLESAGEEGGTAVVSSRARGGQPGAPPTPGAQRLLDRVRPEAWLAELAPTLLADVWVVESPERVAEDFDGIAVTRAGRMLDARRGELAQAPAGGGERLLEERNRRTRLVQASTETAAAEGAARKDLERALAALTERDEAREQAEVGLRRALRELSQTADEIARTEWLVTRRRQAPEEGPEAVRRAELQAELRAGRLVVQREQSERVGRERSVAALQAGIERDVALAGRARRAAAALEAAVQAVTARREALEAELRAGAATGEETGATLRACALEEAELQNRLKRASDQVTAGEVAAQQVRDSAAESERELGEVAARLGVEPAAASQPLDDAEREALRARVERLARRREQLGPVNPLAKDEYEQALAHVEELELQRRDLEDALAELEGLIRETDRRIREAFEQTFDSAARNFEDVIQHLFPGGRGRLRLVQDEQGPRPLIGGADPAPEAAPEPSDDEQARPEAGVEVEVTPAGKATKRLSLLSGGEKSLVALAFMFAVFLARPCPFYILDEVEAALDDVNIDRFLELVRRYSDRAQFIVVTHQKRTMDAADTLYGVSMGGDGVSRVLSRRLASAPAADEAAA